MVAKVFPESLRRTDWTMKSYVFIVFFNVSSTIPATNCFAWLTFEIYSISQCFRRSRSKADEFKSHCCSMSLECDHEIPLPPLPKLSSNRPSTITGSTHGTALTDFDGLSEKYWGEILERTFSSNSLHALQHHHQHNHHTMHDNKHHFSNNTTFSDINLNRSEANLYYSNSEPRLCEHDLHDINCAKNKAFFGTFNKDENI